MEYTDVMLDIETMGNKSNSAIVSIGAVEFNMITGEIGREFYKVVDLQSSLDAGLKINASTVYFWLQQNQQARDGITVDKKIPLATALHMFGVWMQDCIKDVNIWGNGARFDIGLMEDAHEACGLKNPWNFRSERDVRTLVSFAPHIKANHPFTGIHHNPIDDCKHQISYCNAIWKKFNSNI
jgi:hypothetical protein